MVVALFVANLLWALAWSWPFYRTLADATALRPFAEPLAHGLHVDVMAEIFARHPEIASVGQAGAAASAVGWVIVSWFLTGGVLGLCALPPAETSLRRFGAEAGGRGPAMARLWLWFVPHWAMAALIAAMGGGMGSAAGAHAANSWWTVGGGILGALPGLVALLLVSTMADVARARLTLMPQPVARVAMTEATRLVLAHPRCPVGVQLLGGLVWLGASGLYLAVAWPFPYASGPAFALLFLLRQALVLARAGVRVATLDANLEYVQSLPLNAQPIASRASAPTPVRSSEPPLAATEQPPPSLG
jgi:hypothetical protein